MAQYFARIQLKNKPFDQGGQHWEVQNTVVVGNDIPTADGPLVDNPRHADGETWVTNWFKGGTWRQTFKDGLRGKFAAPSDIYDYEGDKFIPAQPYASWTLQDDDTWDAPVPFPTVETYTVSGVELPYGIMWDEDNLRWKGMDNSTPTNLFIWDPETLTWTAE
jgi:hypothetical protein